MSIMIEDDDTSYRAIKKITVKLVRCWFNRTASLLCWTGLFVRKLSVQCWLAQGHVSTKKLKPFNDFAYKRSLKYSWCRYIESFQTERVLIYKGDTNHVIVFVNLGKYDNNMQNFNWLISNQNLNSDLNHLNLGHRILISVNSIEFIVSRFVYNVS